jgi:CRISPR-associated endonuclease/helicase Cas3
MPVLDSQKNYGYFNLWAKTTELGTPSWHPLILHLLDVAACAGAILQREPETTRQRMAEVLGLPWEEAKPWILLVVACHDLGKASPGFQHKWPGAKALLADSGLEIPRMPDTGFNHAFVSQIALAELLQGQGWPQELAELSSDAVGCHHGSRAGPTTLDRLAGNRNAIGRESWVVARREIFEALRLILGAKDAPVKPTLSGPDFMLLSGLASFADWIGSDEKNFPFGKQEECADLGKWFAGRRQNAEKALDSIGWQPRELLSEHHQPFNEVFNFPPRPLQTAVADFIQNTNEPCVLLVEAPMGEGKTEAALCAFLDLQRNMGHRGLYVALPTKATGNAMFNRVLNFLDSMKIGRILDLQLLHGAAKLNDNFERLKISNVYNSDEKDGEGKIRASEWFTRKKRALLSEYGVGTVDQALLPILPVRHHFVRLWGLANRVVVFDEIHAYDAYTGTLLLHLIRWLLALGSSVILLSATLPPVFRRKLAEVVGAGFPNQEAAYPRVSIFKPGSMEQRHFQADPSRKRHVILKGIAPDIEAIHTGLRGNLAGGGTGLALVNTVQRAQELYQAFPEGMRLESNGICIGKKLSDGTEIYLFHARYPADKRQVREDAVLETFGKKERRDGRKILIATQVAEQSLDLDFDVMITDLAPVDLVLQRAGRLWRHERGPRAVKEPCLFVSGLMGDKAPSFGKPLWWDKVYREDLLLRTWNLLQSKKSLVLPDEIDVLVQAVYEGLDEMVPDSLRERLMDAEIEWEGQTSAYRNLAHQAFIGFPDDASWNEPARYAKADEDDPGLHPTLVAQTRLGEPSVTVVSLFPKDEFRPQQIPEPAQAKAFYMRSLSLSRYSVVKKLRDKGVPEGWKKSPLLRNCLPLVFDDDGRWKEDYSVKLDEELGLVYGEKEVS